MLVWRQVKHGQQYKKRKCEGAEHPADYMLDRVPSNVFGPFFFTGWKAGMNGQEA